MNAKYPSLLRNHTVIYTPFNQKRLRKYVRTEL